MVDINDLSLAAEFDGTIDEVTEGADQSFFAPPAPPDDGPHTVTLSLGRDGITLRRQRVEGDSDQNHTGQIYLSVHLELRPEETSGESGYVLFDRVTSIKLANTGTSRLRGVLAKAGVPIPVRVTLPEMKAHVESALVSKPTVKVFTAWRGSVKLDGKYVDVFRRQSEFPRDASGKPTPVAYVRVAQVAGGDQKPQFAACAADDPDAIEVKAQAVPVRYEFA